MRWTDTHRERFVARVEKTAAGCWIWKGWTGPYGRFGRFAAHRASYEMHVGPIPDGLFIDHLCGVKQCVNPAHLEPVTHIENIRRHWRKVQPDGLPSGKPSRMLREARVQDSRWETEVDCPHCGKRFDLND